MCIPRCFSQKAEVTGVPQIDPEAETSVNVTVRYVIMKSRKNKNKLLSFLLQKRRFGTPFREAG